MDPNPYHIPRLHHKLGNHDSTPQTKEEQAGVAISLPRHTEVLRSINHEALDAWGEHREEVGEKGVKLGAGFNDNNAGSEEDSFERDEGIEDWLGVSFLNFLELETKWVGGLTSWPNVLAAYPPLRPPSAAHLCAQVGESSPPARTYCIVGSHQAVTKTVNATTQRA